MSYVLSMTVVDTLQDLLEYLSSIFLIKELLFNNLIKQLSTLTHFSDKVHILGVFEVLIKLNDMWMINLLQYLNFCLEPLPVLNLIPWNSFASSNMASGEVLAFINDPISTTAKCLLLNVIDLLNSLSVLYNHC